MDPFLMVTLVGYAVLAAKVWAFLDAWRWPNQAYRQADRLNRPIWLAVIALSIVLQLWQGVWRAGDDNTGRALSFMAGLVVLMVYTFDVRRRVRAAAEGE